MKWILIIAVLAAAFLAGCAAYLYVTLCSEHPHAMLRCFLG